MFYHRQLAKRELCDIPEQNNKTSSEPMSFCSTIRLLFTNQMFLVFLLSNYLMSCGCHIIFAVIPQFGVELQVEKTHVRIILVCIEEDNRDLANKMILCVLVLQRFPV